MRSSTRRQFLQASALAAIPAQSTIAKQNDGLSASPTSSPVATDMNSLGFREETFSDGTYQHTVYRKGQGPAVIVMHELPGMDMHAVQFANRLVEHGFEVHMPLLFGDPLESSPSLNFVKLCISKEFAYLKSNTSAPVCDWLRSFANHLGQGGSGRHIGVIGMCVTGAFAIPVIIDSKIKAAVISQPSVPLSIPYYLTKIGDGKWMEQLNIADVDLDNAVATAKQDNLRVIVQRFKEDRLCPPRRAQRIANAFGENASLFEYDRPRPEADKPHALLTVEYDKADGRPNNPTHVALARVVAFLHEHLDGQSAGTRPA